jgi:bifunctional non-homologous end joining protein LigD
LFPELVVALSSIPLSGLVLEGEIAVLDSEGVPDEAALATRVELSGKKAIAKAALESPATLFTTDLLACSGRDARPVSLAQRKHMLARIVGSVGFLRYSDHIEAHGEALCREVVDGKAPGCDVVARRADAPYHPGQSQDYTAIELGSSAVSAPNPTATVRPTPRMTNRDKVFWPDEGITKGHLLDYYRCVAASILPYLKDRPLVLTRFPDGIGGKWFFQHHAPGAKSAWLRTTRIKTSRRYRDYFIVEDPDDLIYLVNLGTFPLHVWPSRADSLERPDWCTIDIDRSESTLDKVIEVALVLRELCESIDLPTFIKTSGGEGLHVCIPLGGALDYDKSRLLGELLARTIERENPGLGSTEGPIKRRRGRVYLDHMVNARGRMLVAPLSARAKQGATVSTPLAWEEVDRNLDPKSFTIATVPARLERIDDPWRDFLTTSPDLSHAVEELSARLSATR